MPQAGINQTLFSNGSMHLNYHLRVETWSITKHVLRTHLVLSPVLSPVSDARGRDLVLKEARWWQGMGAGLCLEVGKDFLKAKRHFMWGFEG